MLWLDSDMQFEPDLIERLGADIDQGLDFVSGLYFTRKSPVKPCVYEICRPTEERGEIVPTAESFKQIPDGIFEIEACGFGAVMMTTDLILRAGPLPFFPSEGFGEDLTFCRKLRAAGVRLYCDGSIKLNHIGTTFINEQTWKEEGRALHGSD